MTPNNEVKAPRPCSIEDTGSKRFISFPTEFVDTVRVVITGAGDFTTGHIEVAFFENKFKLQKVIIYFIQGDNLKHFHEVAKPYFDKVLQAIASAQRPWLKAEGFEFDYQDHNTFDLIVKDSQDDNKIKVYLQQPLEAMYDNYFGHTFYGFDVCGVEDITAFKPASDSQEAWDAVAGVEVYKGVQ